MGVSNCKGRGVRKCPWALPWQFPHQTELGSAPLSSIVHTADGSSFLVDLLNHQPQHVDFEGSDYHNWNFIHELRSTMDLFQESNNNNMKQKTNHKRRVKGKTF